jgi:hypothetical protein
MIPERLMMIESDQIHGHVGEKKAVSDGPFPCFLVSLDGFRFGKSHTSQTVPEDGLFPKLSVPELLKQLIQRNETVKETTLKKFWWDWLHLSIDAGSYLMILFLGFILINAHKIHASDDCVSYDSTKVPEATAAFYHTMSLKTLQLLRAKECE